MLDNVHLWASEFKTFNNGRKFRHCSTILCNRLYRYIHLGSKVCMSHTVRIPALKALTAMRKKNSRQLWNPVLTCWNPAGELSTSPRFPRIYGRIPGDHPCGNFLIIPLRKFRGNEAEFSMWIFPYLSCGIPGDISTWKFPLCFPQNFQNAI